MPHQEWSRKLAGQIETQQHESKRLRERAEELLRPPTWPDVDRRKTNEPVVTNRRKKRR